MRCTLPALCVGLLVLVGGPVRAADDELANDELKLQALGLDTDGPSLLAFLNKRSLAHVEADNITPLVKQLGDASATTRTQAVRELIALGPVVVPHLRRALSDPDDKLTAAQARRVLKGVEGEEAKQVSLTVVRLLGQKKPEGLTKGLLAFLPFVEDGDVLAEVKAVLIQGARDKEDRADSELLKALQDPLPLRRAVAIEALTAQGIAEPREALSKLLLDPKPAVRLQAALALAQTKDPKAVSTLILLLAELPEDDARRAEEWLLSFAEEVAPKAPVRADDVSRQKARDAWAQWWLATEDSRTLLDEFRNRTMTEEERLKCESLVKELGSDEFQNRQNAEKELMKKGVLVLPMLRKLVKADNGDAEVIERATRVLAAIEKTQAGPLPLAMARVVAYRKPVGAVPVLLNFMIFAEDASTLTEVQQALNAVAVGKDGKIDPALLAALSDKVPVRRAAAAEALTTAGGKHADEVRRLLTDPVASVRQQVALALARNLLDREAVPALIKVIADLPGDEASPAEEYLTALAGPLAPEGLTSGSDDAARKKRSAEWEAWWKKNGAKVALERPRREIERERYLGLTLVISPNFGTILELDKEGKEKWRLPGLQQPMDAEVIGQNKLMVLHTLPQTGVRVLSEMTFKGDVLNQISLPQNVYPVAFQRLPNGHIFLTGNNRLLVLDRKGKELWSYNRPASDIFMARRLKDGSVVAATSSAIIFKLDAQGREVKQYRYNGASNMGIDIRPNGNVIYPMQYNNQVAEVDGEGKQIWTAQATRPVDVQRLSNGNTVIACISPQVVVEVDARGKEVFRAQLQVQPQRIRRR